MQLLNDKVERVELKVDNLEQKLDTYIEEDRRDFEANRQEHQQMLQMITKLDKEVQVEIKRLKKILFNCFKTA